jgi:hypothetical protein
LQVPPHWSLTLQSRFGAEPHCFVQQARPPLPLEAQVSPGAQATLQMPPQPSLSPHCLPVQSGLQQVLELRQVWPLGQVQLPPQPSPELHLALPLPSVQEALQQARPPSAWLLMHCSPAPQPMQMPPQPSLSPHCLPSQLGAQHLPAVQGMPFAHLQVFPQPSSTPQTPGAQFGWQQPVPPSSSV